MLSADTRHTARKHFSFLGDEFLKFCNIFIVDGGCLFETESTNFLLGAFLIGFLATGAAGAAAGVAVVVFSSIFKYSFLDFRT